MKAAPAVELILTDGIIHTLDPALGSVQSLAIANGRIVRAGTSDAVRSLAGAGTEILPLQGRVVLPGLSDAHLHLEQLAFNASRVDCVTSTFEGPSRIEHSAPLVRRSGGP